jgi:hypothetical protein
MRAARKSQANSDLSDRGSENIVKEATMAKAPADLENVTINIQPLKRGIVRLRIVGTTALFQNRMANKAKQQLLTGGQKKGKADRAAIKHDPLKEFKDSAEILLAGPTALGLRTVAVKAAMCTAALETPGLKKTEAQRLLGIPGDHVALYGTPQLRMDVVRMADMNRTPDIRSRCYLPRWGVEVEIHFITPQLAVQSVIALLCNAGVLIGVGDFRQEKGKGSYGSFRVLGEDEDDAEWNDLITNHGRAAQEAALDNPEYANRDTADLMEYFASEVKRRSA